MVGEIDSTKVFNTFVAGLITEAGPLTFPENSSKDELNCVLNRKGNRRRRLGVDYESSGALSATTLTDTAALAQAIHTEVWTSVAGSGSRNFLVLQIDTTLHFYDLATSPLSSGKKGFTQSINSFGASGATDLGSEPVNIVSGRGLMFVASSKLEPFYIEYDAGDDSIAATQISLEIRDFDGLVESPAITNDNEPATLSTTHEYNLKNQGWNSPGAGVNSPITDFFSSKAVYPPNSKQWWAGKDSNDSFDATLLTKFDAGNTLAPRGHYLLNPFYKDRTAASGVSGINVESESKRPEVLAFFAGRVWYMGVDSSKINGHIYFSQVLLTAAHSGRCHQEADPSSEDLAELIDSDGGVVVIPEIGKIRGAIVKDRFLIIFASNGVWAVSGGGTDGFKATDFQVQEVTSVGVTGEHTIVRTEAYPMWWSEQGIYTIQIDQISGALIAQSMTQQTIETFYQDDIPSISKTYARGAFDEASKKIYWLYNTVAPTNDADRWRFNAVLIFDTSLGAFYPWKISDLTNDSPYVFDVFNLQAIQATERIENVIDSSGNTVINVATDNIVTNVSTIAGNTTFLKFIAIVPNSGDTTNTWVFCEFNNGDFVDWETNDSTGITYNSYWEMGYELFGSLTKKQVPYVQLFFNKTETGTAGGVLTAPSSLFMQSKWDWTSSGDTGRWSALKQVYRLKREFDSGIVTDERPGEDVIVSEEKVRGHGKAFQLRFESEAGKDFDVAGWQVFVDQQTNV
jgi:hypothetical protein|tara:strand:+ start:1326 stop:3548 length:2223 start_codon:yes stop_codon:yes gene_type:complete